MIVTIGLHIIDVCVVPVDEIPRKQDVAIVDDINISVAGTAAGTAVNLAKLGNDVVTVGAVGNDEMGDILLRIMGRYGINIDYIKKKENNKTSCTVLPIRKNGERPALHLIGANATLCYEDIPHEIIKSANFCHIGGFYLLKSFDGEPTLKTLRLAKDSGAITTMDIIGIKCENMSEMILPCMEYLDYFMPNLEEAQLITGLQDIDEIADYFLRNGANAVVLKMGSHGSFIKTKTGLRRRQSAFMVKVVDTTGCGDAFNSGFITALSKGMSETESVEFGSACGSLCATGLSSNAGIINYEETLKFMKTTPSLPLEIP